MAKGKQTKVALVGNPNSGKTTLFNLLTGLNQKTGNFPGVTVDKKSGSCKLPNDEVIEVIDLPGTYSIYPKSIDEQVVQEVLLNPDNPQHPDKIVVVCDAANLTRNLLLFTQIKDLGIPSILVLNMIDVAETRNLKIDQRGLGIDLGVKVVATNSHSGGGLDALKEALSKPLIPSKRPFYDATSLAPETVANIREAFGLERDYVAYQFAQQREHLSFLEEEQKTRLNAILTETGFSHVETQSQETQGRYQLIAEVVKRNVKAPEETVPSWSRKIDRILTHKVFGFVIFFGLLMLIFQSIFAWADAGIELIENGMSVFTELVRGWLPEGLVNDLITDGILAGLAGVFVFIPQIAILFAFISLLEETGYMSRAVFLMDMLMRKVGLNGKSVVPLISGMACAIPAVMATRNIESWKDRLITIFVTPFMSCSARLPVYTILIGLVVPEETYFGLFNLQGLVLMGLYLLGFLAAIVSALGMKYILKATRKSYFVMELPDYKVPSWKNVLLTIYDKSRTFVLEAGKVIVAISIILWVLASYGSSDEFKNAEENVRATFAENYDEEAYQVALSSYKLEHSFAGAFGKTIEPVIKPLGYDWKIGIALITSFAAREVFVGTMSTIYSIGGEDEVTIRERLRQEKDPETGAPVYTVALGFSLMVFYAFAMQCMSTLAIVYRETKGWKWPLLQMVYMTVVAYGSAFITYQIFS